MAAQKFEPLIHHFIEINNGAHKSDYGKVYNICGCCTENIKECKGQ